MDPGQHHMGGHGADDEQLAVVAAAGSSGLGIVPGLERQRGLVDLNKPDKELRSGSVMARRSLMASKQALQ